MHGNDSRRYSRSWILIVSSSKIGGGLSCALSDISVAATMNVLFVMPGEC